MAAATASATLIAPPYAFQPVRHALVSAAMAETAVLPRRRPAPAPRPPETGPDMEAIYYDARGIGKARHRGTHAYTFLSVDGIRPKPFQLMLESSFADEMQFGGAYNIAVDYGDEAGIPLVVTAPRYISQERTVTPHQVLFNTNTKGVEITADGGTRRIDFARGEEAAKMLLTLGMPKGEWRPVDDRENAHLRTLKGAPETLTVHSVVTRGVGKWHAMGLPSIPGSSGARLTPVVTN